MGMFGSKLNKALHPVGGKAILTRIIEKFPSETEFVIGLGHLGHQVREFLSLAHEQSKFTFIEVDNYQGSGSGPGYSLLCCRHALEKPFYFVSCDTLWTNDFDWSLPGNWFGVAPIDPDKSASYCNLMISGDRVVGVRDKEMVKGQDFRAFVGLCRVEDYTEFWTGLANKEEIAGEHQISSGLKALIAGGRVFAQTVKWIDVGDAEKYRAEVARFENFDFSKRDEALYMLNDKVVKFFADEAISKKRVEKAALNPKVFPKIRARKGQFYSYDFQIGATLYSINSPELFARLLRWLKTELWLSRKVPQEEMRQACNHFYRQKTQDRVELFFQKYPPKDEESSINGSRVPCVRDLLQQVPWERICEGVPSFIHGDLQFDNILYDSNADKFVLLDWRHDFGGSIELGDIYYDLAKILGGIILNYDYIKLNLLSYSEKAGSISYDFARRVRAESYISVLYEYCALNGYDVGRVRLLVALIYLNMSPLHHYPFDKLLFALGKNLLHKELSGMPFDVSDG